MNIKGISNQTPPDEGISAKLWDAWFPKGSGRAGEILGHLERIVFFIAAWLNAYEILGWFALKVASKWEVWTNVKRPAQFEGSSELDSFRSRNIIGTILLGRFLIGTIGNLIIGFAATYLGKHSLEVIQFLSANINK